MRLISRRLHLDRTDLLAIPHHEVDLVVAVGSFFWPRVADPDFRTFYIADLPDFRTFCPSSLLRERCSRWFLRDTHTGRHGSPPHAREGEVGHGPSNPQRDDKQGMNVISFPAQAEIVHSRIEEAV